MDGDEEKVTIMTRALGMTISISLLLCVFFLLPQPGWTMLLWSSSEQLGADNPKGMGDAMPKHEIEKGSMLLMRLVAVEPHSSAHP